MKTKEELNAMKEEVETVNRKLRELTKEELAQVTGGHDEYIEYVIQRGDCLSVLAQRYGTTVEILCKLNNIENPDLIYAGAILRIPIAE